MFNQGFTVSGSALKLLQIGERGLITNFRTQNEVTLRKLRTSGIKPGSTMTLEQRFPRFLIKVGTKAIALDEDMIGAIYVRLLDQRTGLKADTPTEANRVRAGMGEEVGALAISQS